MAVSLLGYGEGTAKVQVTDGKLTLSTPYTYNKDNRDGCNMDLRRLAAPICYVEVTLIDELSQQRGTCINALDTLNGHVMAYRLFIPAGYSASQGYPIVNLFHRRRTRHRFVKVRPVSFCSMWTDAAVQDR